MCTWVATDQGNIKNSRIFSLSFNHKTKQPTGYTFVRNKNISVKLLSIFITEGANKFWISLNKSNFLNIRDGPFFHCAFVSWSEKPYAKSENVILRKCDLKSDVVRKYQFSVFKVNMALQATFWCKSRERYTTNGLTKRDCHYFFSRRLVTLACSYFRWLTGKLLLLGEK